MDQHSEKNMRFFQLYNSVHTRIYSFLLILVHNHADAEELLQETAAVLWEKFETFQDGTNFGAWAVQIAKNKALEFLRNNQKTRMIFESSVYSNISRVAERSSIDSTERSQALDQCLTHIGDQDRKLLMLRYQKNVSVKKISQMTGRSLNGLYQSYSRIIELLRSCMKRKLAETGR